MKSKNTLLQFLAIAASSLLAVSSTHAGQNWDGGSSLDSNISTASNWDGATVNADGTGALPNFTQSMTFSGNTRTSINNNRSAASSFAQLSFANDGTSGKTNAFTITGNSMTLTNNLTTSAVTGSAITDTIGVNLILTTNPVIAPSTNHHLSITGVISGAQFITKRSAGTLTLSNANSYTGSTFIEQGTIIAATDSLANTNGAFGKQTSNINLGLAGGSNAAGILINDGNFTVGRAIRNATSDGTDSGTRVLTLGGNTAHNTVFSGDIFLGTLNQTSKGIQLTAAAGGQVSFSGVIQDPTGQDTTEATAAAALTAVTKVGAGTVILSNINTYTGNTSVNLGVLNTTKAAALSGYNASGKVTFNGGTLGVQVGGSGWSTAEVDTLLTNATKTSGALGIDTTNGDVTQWTAFTATNLGSSLGLTKLGANKLTLDQTNNYAGATTVTGGTLQIGNAGTTGSLTGTSSITVGTGSNLTINRSDAFTQATDLNNKVITGAGSFTKAGGGTTTLSLTNTYSGATTVSTGTLYVTGSLSNSAVTVQANGTVGSNGAAGARALGNGLTIEAGGNLDLAGATIGLNSTDVLSLTGGSLTLGNLTFQDIVGWDWANAAAGTYELIDGTFSIDWGSTAYLSEATAYDFGNGKKGYFTSGSLNAVIVAVPEPSAALLGCLGLLALLRRRRA